MIIALAILGIGLTVIIEVLSGGLRLGRVSEEYTRAMNYAALKMEEISTQKTIEEGDKEGEFDKTFRWRMGVEKTDLIQGKKSTESKPPAELYHKINILVPDKGCADYKVPFIFAVLIVNNNDHLSVL